MSINRGILYIYGILILNHHMYLISIGQNIAYLQNVHKTREHGIRRQEALSAWLCSFACFHARSRRRERRGFARHNDNFTQCCLRQRNTPTTLFPQENSFPLEKDFKWAKYSGESHFGAPKWPALLRGRAIKPHYSPFSSPLPQNRTRPRGKSTNIARIFRKPPDAQ